MNERVVSLLKYLNLEVKDVTIEKSKYDDNVFIINGKEYMILTDKEADEVHKDYIASFVDDAGISGFSEFAQGYIFDYCIDTSWFDDAMRESFEFYIEDIRNETASCDEFSNRLEEEMAEACCDNEDSYIEHLCLSYENAVEWYRDNFGEDSFNQAVNTNCYVDISKISEFCIEHDGRGHSLSSYDGNELELDNEYYAYRVC